jgi:hypothetical protein
MIDQKVQINSQLKDLRFTALTIQNSPDFSTYYAKVAPACIMLVKHHNKTHQPLQAEYTIDQLEDWAVLSWLDLNRAASLVTDGELGAKTQALDPFTNVEKSSIMKYDDAFRAENLHTDNHRYTHTDFTVVITPPSKCVAMSNKPFLLTILNTWEWNPQVMDNRFKSAS